MPRTTFMKSSTLFLFAAAVAYAPTASAQTKTATTTKMKMPEDGGPLPRATMPEGGVGDTTTGTPDELPRAKMPEGGANLHCHLHEHHGVEHSHCHEHAESEGHDHDHAADEHCHEHEHDGSVHSHCHGHAEGRAHGHDHPDGVHCHEHEHDGGAPHEHCHDEGDPEHDHHADAEDCHAHDGETHCHEGKTGHEHPTGEEDCHEHDGETHCHDGEDGHDHGMKKPVAGATADMLLGGTGMALRWNGYLRAVTEFIENDPRSTFIGRNDGFKLINARLGVRASKGNFFSYVSFDAAAGERERFNDPNVRFGMRLRDAYLAYDLSQYADVFAGRFKTPYDLASLKATGALTFIDRPVYSRGVLPGTGFEVEGMQQGRQLGVMVGKTRIGLSEDGFDIGYALALTNGNTGSLALNDNDRPALFGRVSGHYGDIATLNVGGFTDARTVGDLPDLFDEDVSGTEVSAHVHVFDFDLEAQLLFITTSFDGARPSVNSLGLHAQWAYTIWGVTFAYRFAWYEPNTTDLDDADQRTEHTIGVAYGLEGLPLTFILNGTVAGEQQGRQVDNNRLALLAQFIF
ncbi:MAG: porin [Deltaproteobacteria bacterium]